MDILEAMRARYSVRQYTTQPLSAAQVQRLQEEIDTNREIRLHVQLIKDELKAVQGFLDHDGKLQFMRNDVAMIETKEMIKYLDCPGCLFRSNHASNYVNLRGTLNQDKETMIHLLDEAIKGNIHMKSEWMRAL